MEKIAQNDFFTSFFNTWLQNYFAESGKSGFTMRLQYFQARERYTKEFIIISIALFSAVSGILIGSKGMLSEIKNGMFLLVIAILFLLQVVILIYSILLAFRNLKNVKEIMEFHIGYAEKMTSNLLPKIAKSISVADNMQYDSSYNLISSFWDIYKPDADEYVARILLGEKTIKTYEKKQSRILIINLLCFALVIFLIVFTMI